MIEVVETEEITIEDVGDDTSAEQIVNNKKHGFRCADPTKQEEKNNEGSEKPKAATYASATANKDETYVPKMNKTPPAPSDRANRPCILFCSFYNNGTGECFYGEKCKFLHAKSPLCRYTQCNKTRCMFQHPQRSAFLDRRPSPYSKPPMSPYNPSTPPPPMSPWPWMFPQMDPSMFQGMWNAQHQQNNARGMQGNQGRY